ncbi:hypothetical protein VIBNISOn1_1690024 [Vibrio nigripulchritudo SOn1]|uniref:Uncharacterized protein n=1 Tax=Vibrio nigripulchritudo SOn1 TaxID=1238450 RepID=A0AAV2VN87_9VIBR|nr:hypothetical protein VIBNISFn118_890004 [Vibrio nigripulchritudo SFn118]CCO46179.1 hypothetical protein VIBNISOn1_1690024 [Vibrio nigripulchritudo SOn1]
MGGNRTIKIGRNRFHSRQSFKYIYLPLIDSLITFYMRKRRRFSLQCTT